MAVEITFHNHQLVLEEETPELEIGDAVEFTVTYWEGGEQPVTGEVVGFPAEGRVKLRLGGNAQININARACRITLRAAERRAA